MHAPHHTLAGYSDDQVLIAGCEECEWRSQQPDHGLVHLDRGNFARAWSRAHRWDVSGLPDISPAEVPLFRCLVAVQHQLMHAGIRGAALESVAELVAHVRAGAV